jgi:ribosomal protein L37E
MTEQKKKGYGPKGGTNNPRIQEARRLRGRGKTDADLLALGYTKNEIARCRACGWKAILDEDRVCMACQMLARLKREERERTEVKKQVEVVVERCYEHFDHPAIIRSGK